MLDSLAMPAATAAVVDALNSLLEAEMNSIFRFMEAGSPYLDRATAELRKPLSEMVAQSHRHAETLARTIDALGAVPLPRQLLPEEQYLSYLSFKFLLPKLIEAKKLMIRRYQNALAAIKDAPPEVLHLLRSQMAEHQADLETLEKAHA